MVFFILLVLGGGFIRLGMLLPTIVCVFAAFGFAFAVAFEFALAFFEAVAFCFSVRLPPQSLCLFEI